MTVVSSKEFMTNEDKYFEIALKERVFIKKGSNMFIVTSVSNEESEEEDDDFADYLIAKERENDEKISADEFIDFLNNLNK